MRLIDILTNLKNWSFDINGPYRLQKAEAEAIREAFADINFLEFLKHEMPQEELDKYLAFYNGWEGDAE